MADRRLERAVVVASTAICSSLAFQFIVLVPLGLAFMKFLTRGGYGEVHGGWTLTFGEFYWRFFGFPGRESLREWFTHPETLWEWLTEAYTDIFIILRTSAPCAISVLLLLVIACALCWTRKYRMLGLYVTAVLTVVFTALLGGFALQIGRQFLR